jgi:DNA mismatch repair protein MutS
VQCKAYTAHKYNYCKPVFLNNKALPDTPSSSFQFTGIRHPLIEHLQTNELYVTNDLALGNSEAVSGILLYGTNAVGKTSFIKSVGIAVIMAQAGLYVPCTTFVYEPYRNLFTRILGNDNLFKGLSTFAVEMTELRTILTLADAHSLVLGDELCSGTESDSALSIFTAGLEILHARDSTFLFATHFHEMNKYEEITRLTKMKMFHMAVHYNQETQTLVYDRKLREGPGESMYGLEVCKSLHLPAAFLERAHEIRLKYQPMKQNVLSFSPTHFNAKKLVGNCEICRQAKASEVHHLQPQKKASPKNEYITQHGQSFHKNHVANLLNICEQCHNTIHRTNAEHKVVKTSAGYILSKL